MDIEFVKGNKRETDKFSKVEWKKFYKEQGGIKEKYKEYRYKILHNEELIDIIIGWTYSGVAYLDNMVLKSEYRNKKIGHKILQFWENIAKKQKCHKLSVKTCPGLMPNALYLYKKHGYRVEANINNDYHNKDWVILSKFIDDK